MRNLGQKAYSSKPKDFHLAQTELIKTKRLFGGCRAPGPDRDDTNDTSVQGCRARAGRAGPLVEMTEKAISGELLQKF